jgi:hypothetical protein
MFFLKLHLSDYSRTYKGGLKKFTKYPMPSYLAELGIRALQ